MHKFRLRRLGVADDPGHYRPTLQGCLEAVVEQSDTLVDDVLAGLQTALVPGKTSAAGVVREPLPPQLVRSLVEQSIALKRVFAQHLRAALFGGDRHRQVEQTAVRFDDFQFLEANQINAHIEFALTQQEVLLSVEEVMPELNGMISHLMGWASVQGHLNPLKPESFVFALRETLCQFVPEEAARATVLALAGAKMGVTLRQLYGELTDWLRSTGVESVPLPSSSVGAARNEVPTRTKRNQLTLDKLRRLLSGELAPDRAAGAADFSPTIPSSFDALEDMKMVESMLKRLAERPAKAEEAPSAERQAEAASKKTLGIQLGEEVVRLMLDNLLKDDRLLPAIRQHLSDLEPALLKLSQSDQRFFSEKNHPARLFLDRMTDRSLAFSTEQDAGFVRFSAMFGNAIAVLRNGDGDAPAFDRMLRKLEDDWAREESEQREQRERAARALLLVEQRNLLAQKLALQYRQRMAQQPIPELVQNFLVGPWAQVTAQAQLATADGLSDPEGYISLADDLLWSVQPRLTRHNRGRLIQLLPTLIFRIRAGLQQIDYPADQTTGFFNELMALHAFAEPPARSDTAGDNDVVDASDGASSALAEREGHASMALPPDPDDAWLGDVTLDGTEMVLASQLEVSPAPDAEGSDPVPPADWSLDALEAGAWVDLSLNSGWVRAQLTWASPRRTLFMFVSGGGHSHSMSQRTLRRLRDAGRLRLVSDGRVMQNALDAVAQTALRNAVVKDLNERLG